MFRFAIWRIDACHEAMPLAVGIGRSDVEAELDDVALLHDIVLAFRAEQAGGAERVA
jgi:hypothetical protein